MGTASNDPASTTFPAARTVAGDIPARAKPAPFFGGFPERGIWTAVGLTRNQFAAILTLSVVLFVAVGGPLWTHVRDAHFTRITVSYAVIPIGVMAALYRNGNARPLTVAAATVVVALVKLVVTTVLLIGLALAAR